MKYVRKLRDIEEINLSGLIYYIVDNKIFYQGAKELCDHFKFMTNLKTINIESIIYICKIIK